MIEKGEGVTWVFFLPIASDSFTLKLQDVSA